MSIPKPPNSETPPKPTGQLTVNESQFILDTCLSEKHRSEPSVLAFIDSFIRCKNIAQASDECNIHKSLGYKYRHRVDIANVIQKLIDKSAVKHGFDASEIVERVKEMVDFDPVELQNPDGSFKNNLHDIPPEIRRCLKKLKVKNLWSKEKDMNGMDQKLIIGEVIEYEWYDKPKVSELVGKEKKLFVTTTRVEHDVTKNMSSILLESSRRADKAIEHKKPVIDITPNSVETKK